VRLQELANKWLIGTLSREEQEEFEHWFNQASDTPIEVPSFHAKTDDEHKQRLYSRILDRIDGREPKWKIIKWLPYAAAVVLAVIAITWSGLIQQPSEELVIIDAEDVSPGRNQASVTLTNGKTIDL